MYSYVAVACLLGVAAAAPSAVPVAGIAAVESVSIPRYNFNYAVSDPLTGDNKAQSEYRDGGVVRGSYSLSEPDGTLRVVDYAADPVSGFNAVVKRVGQAHHPQVLPVKAVAVAAPVAVAPVATSVIGLGHGGIGLGHGGIGLGYGGIGLGYGGIGHGHGIGLGHGYGVGINHGIGYGQIGLDYGIGLGHGHGGFGHGGFGHGGFGHGGHGWGH